MKRIQRQRTKGWRMPEGAVYVGRPSPWGNPYRLGDPVPRIAGIDTGQRFTTRMGLRNFGGAWLSRRAAEDPAFLAPLKGKNLACWCPLEDANGNRVPCHADVLLELANPGWAP